MGLTNIRQTLRAELESHVNDADEDFRASYY